MKTISIFLSVLILFSSCMSTTMIQTQPSGADIYLDGVKVGKSPHEMTNDKTIIECTEVKIKKEGYETINTSICRNEDVDFGAVIAGLFIWFPFLWAMKYDPVHSYDLQVANSDGSGNNGDNSNAKIDGNTDSKYKNLRELKALLDDGIITKEEYEKEKKKILDNN